MFRSSSKSFWPILVELHELRKQLAPLIVGIYCGKNKPDNIDLFLRQFVEEINVLLRYGMTINE